MPDKRRRTDEEDTQDDAVMASPTTRARRVAVRPPSEQTERIAQFHQDRRSLLDQSLEQINGDMHNLMKQWRPQLESDNAHQYEVAFTRELHYYASLCNAVQFLYDRPVGQVMVCGDNDTNQLGFSQVKTMNSPRIVRGLEHDFDFVTCGSVHNIAISSNGAAYSWGINDEGQLGRGKTPAEDDGEFFEKTPRMITGFKSAGSSGQVQDNCLVQAAAGEAHSVFVAIDGTAYSCGGYKYPNGGAFFRDPPAPHDGTHEGIVKAIAKTNLTPVPLHRFKGEPVAMVDCGLSFCAALMGDGNTIKTFGIGISGELARDEELATTVNEEGKTVVDFEKLLPDKPHLPEKPKRNYDANKTKEETEQEYEKAVVEYRNDVQEYHNVLLPEYKRKIRVFDEIFMTPRPVVWEDQALRPKKYVMNVACGNFHLMVTARCTAGVIALYASGGNNYGQLGLGDTVNRYKLTRVPAMDGKDIVKVACGNHHTLCLNLSGQAIYGFGRSDAGQLGLSWELPDAGALETLPIRIAFPALPAGQHHVFSQIACGDDQSYCISQDGTRVYSWGFGDPSGSLGHGVAEDEPRPRQVKIMRAYKEEKTDGLVRMISAGSQHVAMVVTKTVPADTPVDDTEPSAE